MSYFTIQDGQRGYKCDNCGYFRSIEIDNKVGMCNCEKNRPTEFKIPRIDQSRSRETSNDPPPKFYRNRRRKNWHLDPKIQAQWHGLKP